MRKEDFLSPQGHDEIEAVLLDRVDNFWVERSWNHLEQRAAGHQEAHPEKTPDQAGTSTGPSDQLVLPQAVNETAPQPNAPDDVPRLAADIQTEPKAVDATPPREANGQVSQKLIGKLAESRGVPAELPNWLRNVDSLSVPEMSLDDRNKIKSILLKAASACHTSSNLAAKVEGFLALPSPDAMRMAFNEIAQVLFDGRNLTAERLREIGLLVWESARMGDWCHITPEMRTEFGEQRGHNDVWSDQEALFRAENAHWRSRLPLSHETSGGEATSIRDAGDPATEQSNTPERFSPPKPTLPLAGRGNSKLGPRQAVLRSILGVVEASTARQERVVAPLCASAFCGSGRFSRKVTITTGC
jgi:hypothetical protein